MTDDKAAAGPPPPVECDMVHPTLMVADVTAAAAFYVDKLGFRLGFTWGQPVSTAGVELDRVSIHLRQAPAPAIAGATRGEIYFVVCDVDDLHRLHVARGVAIVDPLADQPWGLREYGVRDLDGHRLTFGQHLPASEPKLEIDRVDVPARVERRLAGLLIDLAAHKRQTVGECLEEILLHSFEPVATGGVASPHTRKDLAHIQTLRTKHGIDYDAHASGRFSEKP